MNDSESQGYHLEAADGSFDLLIRKETGDYEALFRLESWRVIVEKRETGRVETEATIKIWVDGERYVRTAEGNGPVNALDAALRGAIVDVLDGAIEHYERVVQLPIPDKLPLPLQVHRKAGEPCPRCGTTIEAVHYEDYVMCYCPQDQTGGKVLKDRRLSRLLK